MGAKSRAQGQSDSNSTANPRFGIADRAALRGIFLLLFCFALYLMVVQVYGTVFSPGRLQSALLQFIPYCFVVAGVVYRGRTLAKFSKQTLLMASCLACVFIILAFDVTKNLRWLDAVPLVGRDSGVRNDIASFAIILAIASFPAASYLMMQDMLLAKQRLDEHLEKLEDALRHVQRLQGLLPICMHCHKIRTDAQSWQRIELYISEHSEARFSHGLCPECAEKYYPDLKSRLRSKSTAPPPLLPGQP